jgi:hypothetical protein
MKLRTNQSFIKDQEQKLKIKRISVEVKIHINKRPIKFTWPEQIFREWERKEEKKKHHMRQIMPPTRYWKGDFVHQVEL